MIRVTGRGMMIFRVRVGAVTVGPAASASGTPSHGRRRTRMPLVAEPGRLPGPVSHTVTGTGRHRSSCRAGTVTPGPPCPGPSRSPSQRGWTPTQARRRSQEHSGWHAGESDSESSLSPGPELSPRSPAPAVTFTRAGCVTPGPSLRLASHGVVTSLPVPRQYQTRPGTQVRGPQCLSPGGLA